jgi:hypothetical protein
MSSNPNNAAKWRYSAYSAILFFLIAMPATYFVTNKIFRVVTNSYGAPTYLGVLLHALVFLLVVRLLMQFDI